MIEARGGPAGFGAEEGLRDLLVQFGRIPRGRPKFPTIPRVSNRRRGGRASLVIVEDDLVAPSLTLRVVCPSYFSEQEGMLERPICLAILKNMRRTNPRSRHIPRSCEDTTLAVTKRLPDIRDPDRKPERATLLWIWQISTDAWRWARDFEVWRTEVWTSWHTYMA